MAKKLRSARAFAIAVCAGCGAEWRPRAEIGGYRLLEPLARGGLSLIFRAVEPESGAELAVKLVRPPRGSAAEDFERFVVDVEILAGLEHPNWLRVFGGGIEEDLAWLAMEWLPEARPARGRMGEAEALGLAAQAASALASAEAAGLRHRDFQIGNCLLADAHTLKVSGFAESVFYARAGEEAGTLWGRLCCAPPERIFGEPEDLRSDIYALGAIVFELIAGDPPYEGEVLPELFLERIEGAPLRLEDAVRPVRRNTALLVERMLAIEPERRFQSWNEVLENLAGLLEMPAQDGLAVSVRPRAAATPVKVPVYSAAGGAWFTIAMLAGIAGIAGWFGWRHFHETPLTNAEPAWEVAAISTSAPTTPSPVPTVAAIVTRETPPPPVVPPKSVAPKMDWAVWKKSILESPNRPNSGKGEESRIPGSGALRLRGNNSGLAGGHDECVFFARQIGGDWTLTARVSANDGPAGIIAREGIGSERPCVGIFLGADGKVNSVLRGQPAARVAPARAAGADGARWLRIMRRGSAMSVFHSLDGTKWREAATLNLPTLPPGVPVGFVVWSGVAEKMAGATFEDVDLKLSE